MTEKPRFQPVMYAQNLVYRAIIATLLLLPYETRLRFGGWVVSRLVAPLAGYGRRVRENLALVWPEMPAVQVEELVRKVPANAGRTLIEQFSPAEFKAVVADTPVTGPGLAALYAAREAGKGVVLVSGHFGNYDVVRAVLAARGHKVGGLYKPLSNRYFNPYYRDTIDAISTPAFPKGRRGLAGMVQFLRDGGLIGMLIDQHQRRAPVLTFFGHPAHTALSAAELALKYDTLLVPCYAIRQPDGVHFELAIEAPVPVGTPEAMTQALNDSLEARVRQHPEQYFWIHRRWK
jgi:KDO2-lipid IV(A) lauroyltransferase